MEFLRFGSSIPGSYWGCCAMCIIQDFNQDPDAKSSIQLVDGDGGNPITDGKGFLFAGPTYKDIFWQRLRYGTFGTSDMPNHAFLAVLTDSQVNSKIGGKWLTLLKEAGFEFLRTVDNSVYTGAAVVDKPGKGPLSPHKNYLFGLFRNIGKGALEDPFTPPKQWTDLPSVVPEAWQHLGRELTHDVQEAQLKLWHNLPAKTFLHEEELEKDGVPVVYAGLRSKFPQQLKSLRVSAVEAANKGAPAGSPAPFAVSEPAVPADDYEDDYYEDFESDFDCDCPECIGF